MGRKRLFQLCCRNRTNVNSDVVDEFALLINQEYKVPNNEITKRCNFDKLFKRSSECRKDRRCKCTVV